MTREIYQQKTEENGGVPPPHNPTRRKGACRERNSR
jgi:hypothetical protein